MARRGFGSKVLLCGALAVLVLAPAFASEESAKEKPADKAEATKADAGKDKAPDEAKPAADAEECKPTATRVNTLEDVFGIANWLTLRKRTDEPAAPVTLVAWRVATAESKPAASAN